MMTPLEFEVIVGDAEFCVTTNDVPGIGADCPVWLCEAWCFFSSRLSRYPREQTAQTNGFSPV